MQGGRRRGPGGQTEHPAGPPAEGGEQVEPFPLGLRVLMGVLLLVVVVAVVVVGPLPLLSRKRVRWRGQYCHGWCWALPPSPPSPEAAAMAAAGVHWAQVWVRQPSVALPGGWGLQGGRARPREALQGAWAAATRSWAHH